MFWPYCVVAKTPMSWLPLFLSRTVFSAFIWEDVSRAWSHKNVCWLQHKCQLSGYIYIFFSQQYLSNFPHSSRHGYYFSILFASLNLPCPCSIHHSGFCSNIIEIVPVCSTPDFTSGNSMYLYSQDLQSSSNLPRIIQNLEIGTQRSCIYVYFKITFR